MIQHSSEIAPDLVRRTSGGWLAVAPIGSRFSIAVTAPTQEEAQERFLFTYSRWVSLVEEKGLDVPK